MQGQEKMQGSRPMVKKLQTVQVDIFTDRTQGLTPDRGDRRLWVAVDELHFRFNPKPVVGMSTAEQK
jgi:hypothetical protein